MSTTIGLVAIVKNEAQIIARCLQSVKPLISYYCICDTGSTDETPAIIERALVDIPGELHRVPWRDFATNRSEVMALARAASEVDYLLMLDADLTVEGEILESLTADAYALRIVGGSVEYSLPLLTKRSIPFRYESPVHNYLALDGPWTSEPLPSLALRDNGDSAYASAPGRREQEAKLLQHNLIDKPDDSRSVFYLGFILNDLGRDDEAIEMFERRAGMGGFPEEAFVARYWEGLKRIERNDPTAEHILLDAWAMRSSRAEPLHALARNLRIRGQASVAVGFAELGLRIPLPTQDVLRVQKWVYDWGLRQEYALCLRALGRSKQALAEFRELCRLKVEGEPGEFFQRQVVELNGQLATFKAAKLQSAELPPLAILNDDGWMLPADMLGKLFALVKETEPELVLECGSGASTVALAAALREQGHGHLVTLEHDPHFRERTQQMLNNNDLGDFADVRLAPLSIVENWQWYTKQAWEDLDKIGLLVIDGPPGYTAYLARYPALPLLESRLLPGAPILLDDCDRPDERSTLARWQAELKLARPLCVSHSKANAALLYSANGKLA